MKNNRKKSNRQFLLIIGIVFLLGSGFFYGRDWYLKYKEAQSVTYVDNHLRNNVSNQKYGQVKANFNYQTAWEAYRNNVIRKYGIGILKIPSVGINLPILDGVSEQKMSVGVVTLKANEKPSTGNYALAGHNMTARGNLLHNVMNVKIGEEISVKTISGKFKYTITKIYRHWSKNDGSIINNDQGKKIITIYTCNNLRDNERFVVIGRLLE